MESKRTMEKGILSEQKWTFPITRVRDPDNISILLPHLNENIYCGHVPPVPPLYSKYMGKQSIPFGSWVSRPVGTTSRTDVASLKRLNLANKTPWMELCVCFF